MGEDATERKVVENCAESMVKNQSTISMFFGKQKKEIQWREVFSFLFLVNTVPEKRPYLYLNRDLDRMIC